MGSPWKGSSSKAAAEDRARQILADARFMAMGQLQPDLPCSINLVGVGKAAISQCSNSWHARRIPLGESKPWDWRQILEEKTNPARYELSIWGDGILCGLALGVPNKGNRASYLGILFMEGNPDPAHPLKGYVAPITATVANLYAAALDLRELRIIDPRPQVVEDYYVNRLKFRSVKGQDGRIYCVREVSYA